MTTGRYSRRNVSHRQSQVRRGEREETFFFATIGVSLLLHLIAAVIFQQKPSSPVSLKSATVYVDLITAPPVLRPQRGSSAPSRPLPQPVTPSKSQPTAKSKETTPTVQKMVTSQSVSPVSDDEIRQAVAKMATRLHEKKEQTEVDDSIAKMMKNRSTFTQSKTAAGSPSGTGDEVGSDIRNWLQVAVKEKWSWADRKRKDLSAEVEVIFDRSGRLTDYRFIRTSGDQLFDNSLKRALLSLDPLPKGLHREFRETILFNLEDLQQR